MSEPTEEEAYAEVALDKLREAEDNLLYDYTLFPCSHEVKNIPYKQVDIEGHMYCNECKRVRQIEILRIKRY